LTGLRENVYGSILVMNCNRFNSAKGLSLKNPNKPYAFGFDGIWFKDDFSFFDEIMKVYPQFLNDTKTLFKNHPNGKFSMNYNGIPSYDYINGETKPNVPTYANVIRHLEKVSDEDWNKSELGIAEFLGKVVKNGTWEINENGEVDVRGLRCEVILRDMELTEIPIKFGTVRGDFYCNRNNLTTLKNSPNKVFGSFVCSKNKLTSLEFAPVYVEKDFWCAENLLTDLKTMPQYPSEIGIFDCRSNQLTSLEGITKRIRRLWCSYNELTSFKGLESLSNSRIGGLECVRNNLTSLEGIPSTITEHLWIGDQKNDKVFTKEEVEEVTTVFGKINV
jgi:hypothetical protein